MQGKPAAMEEVDLTESRIDLNYALKRISTLMNTIPQSEVVFLKLCIERNPLITEKVFDGELNKLREIGNASESNKDNVMELVDHFAFLRKAFKKDSSLLETYKEEIAPQKGDNASKQAEFSNSLSKDAKSKVEARIQFLQPPQQSKGR